jgi:hypothetical protein
MAEHHPSVEQNHPSVEHSPPSKAGCQQIEGGVVDEVEGPTSFDSYYWPIER